MDSLKVVHNHSLKMLNSRGCVYWRAVKIRSGRRGGGVDDYLGQECVWAVPWKDEEERKKWNYL